MGQVGTVGDFPNKGWDWVGSLMHHKGEMWMSFGLYAI
jgi:hypothetical protein